MKNSVERRISKAEESTESIQSEGEREAMKKMNKASETTSTSSTSTHVKKNPRRRRERVNIFEEIIAPDFSNLMKNILSKDPGSSTNPK